MKIIFIYLVLLCNSLQSREMMARVTYYWVGTITATGSKPVCGQTIAVDPKIISYGSRVSIPKMGKTFKASDTGSGVIARTAAKKLGRPEAIVVDIFCSSRAVAMRNIKKYPMFMKVKIEENKK